VSRPYATWKHLANRYRAFADDLGDASIVNSHHIAPSEAQVEGRLAAKFTVPFEGVPLQVRELVLDLTYLRWLTPRDLARAADLRTDIDGRIARLLDGTDSLVLEDGTTVTADGAGAVHHTRAGYKPVFDMRDAEDQHVDPDLLDDLDAEDD